MLWGSPTSLLRLRLSIGPSSPDEESRPYTAPTRTFKSNLSFGVRSLDERRPDLPGDSPGVYHAVNRS